MALRANSSERKSQILERKKSKRPRSFLRFLFLSYVYSLGTLLFSHIGGVGCKYIDNARGHVLVVIRRNLVRARPGEDSCVAALQMRRLVGLGARYVL